MNHYPCEECARYIPGSGCQSEQQMACGCCPKDISTAERIEQVSNILQACINILGYLRSKIDDEKN